MAVCPLCNALQQLIAYCSNCQAQLEDCGKVSDFLDPYGHYNDDETVKMGDGYPDTATGQICPHLLACPQCGNDEVRLIRLI